ncbi:MAG: HD domain-containing protein [Defluviitaleaceae bacterium]|nr:HD domain-containing protein [Defluviitaleaceae bacterium]
MPKKTPTAAVIDIGSSELRLRIAQQVKSENDPVGIKYLENLRYPLSLGRDTFQAGKMSFEKVDKACGIIKNFLNVTQDYGVRKIRTVANTAVREADNMDYILDQIKIKTGVDVQVIDDLEEKQLIYKLLTHYASDDLKQSALMVYIGTGSIGISLLEDGKMPRTWNNRVGSLRMSELFGQLQDYTRDFYRLVEEYLAGFINQLKSELPEGLMHFIVSGQDVDLIAKLTESNSPADAPLFQIPRAEFQGLYNQLKRKTTDRIANDYKLELARADTLLPAACIYQNLLNITQAGHITASRLLPCDGILFEMIHEKRFTALDKKLVKSTEQSVQLLSQRYNGPEAHSQLVKEYAIRIFDKIKKIHGLESRDKLLLTAAASLHEIGEYVNLRDHHEHSYALVRGSDIVGLNYMESEIVALLCRYHSGVTPSIGQACYTALSPSDRVRVSKLVAMLRLADALDHSHTQKYSDIDVKLTDTALIVTIQTGASVSLEQWAFTEKGRFFEEVFGIKAELRVKKT